MNSQQRLIGGVLFGAIVTFGLYGLVVHALEGEPRYVPNELYVEECGECHFAYPPDLLPVASWQAIMSGLEDHFGDNAELDEETAAEILAYLEDQGLSRGKSSPMSRLLRGLPEPPPLRITELPAFLNMHYLVARQLEIQEFKEGFLSPCADCHREAALGIYDKDRLHPGYGPANWGGKPDGADKEN